MKTIWVIGGPGCGKGTQCDRMIEKYGFLHLSSGDLLRAEVASGSERGASLQDLMSKGLFVPTDIVLELIKEQMDKAREEGTTETGFLIDGYPREKDQGILFEEKINAEGTVDEIFAEVTKALDTLFLAALIQCCQ
ncbi:Adenylate kinase isoenzyme 1 [Trachymyrmex cornetzi]|uniref:Adenylate kinase isoenzyme 1 n=1 Tax=Trachymyrmex cornetzi TaxID=471704 RepID=A0A151J6W2_9HYME|nr:Adenylate kinase isoenzyme 1 [Trachymyrmex cornetzi]